MSCDEKVSACACVWNAVVSRQSTDNSLLLPVPEWTRDVCRNFINARMWQYAQHVDAADVAAVLDASEMVLVQTGCWILDLNQFKQMWILYVFILNAFKNRSSLLHLISIDCRCFSSCFVYFHRFAPRIRSMSLLDRQCHWEFIVWLGITERESGHFWREFDQFRPEVKAKIGENADSFWPIGHFFYDWWSSSE